MCEQHVTGGYKWCRYLGVLGKVFSQYCLKQEADDKGEVLVMLIHSSGAQ